MTDKLHGYDNAGYTVETKERLLELLSDHANGGLKTLCRNNPELPKANTVFKWINPLSPIYDAEFADAYRNARESQAQDIADGILDDFNRLVEEGMDYRFANVRLSQAQWLAKSYAPRQFGDKKQLEHTSPDGSMTPQQIIIRAVDANSDD